MPNKKMRKRSEFRKRRRKEPLQQYTLDDYLKSPLHMAAQRQRNIYYLKDMERIDSITRAHDPDDIAVVNEPSESEINRVRHCRRRSMDLTKKVDTASVKVMNSYNYCHFEVQLALHGEDREITLADVNELGKEAQRLVDERIRQYKKKAEDVSRKYGVKEERQRLASQARNIRQMVPESERTPEQMAILKELEQWDWNERWQPYCYDDDWQRDDWCGEEDDE